MRHAVGWQAVEALLSAEDAWLHTHIYFFVACWLATINVLAAQQAAQPVSFVHGDVGCQLRSITALQQVTYLHGCNARPAEAASPRRQAEVAKSSASCHFKVRAAPSPESTRSCPRLPTQAGSSAPRVKIKGAAERGGQQHVAASGPPP